MTFISRFSAAFLGLTFIAATVSWPAKAQDSPNSRIALVIGNSAYPDHLLATAANDAGLIAQTLQAAGFDVVGARDLDEKSLRGALRDFLDKAAAAGPDGQAFVYLAGRGVQYEGDNYIVPVDARIARDADVPIEAVKISDFTHALATIPGAGRVIVIDGARATPYAAQGAPLAPGLAQVDPEPGELIAFNAAPGTVAPDEAGPYGSYGKTLAGFMREGGAPIDSVFTQTRLRVNEITGGAVVPWSASNLQTPMHIFDRAPGAPPPRVYAAKRPLKSYNAREAYDAALQRDSIPAYAEYLRDFPDAEEARRVRAFLAARREAAFWLRAIRENRPRSYWTYLRRYPNGPHVADARRRLEILAAELAPPPDFAPVDYDDLPPPPPDERFYEERPVFYFGGDDYGPPPPPPPAEFVPTFDDDWRDLPPPRPQQAQDGYLPAFAVAIPLLAGAVMLSRHHPKDAQGAGAPPAPGAPPRLPGGVRPLPPPPAQAGALKPMPLPVAAPVKPIPAPAAAGASKPILATPLPAPTAGGPTPVPVKPSPSPASGLAKPAVTPLPAPTPGGVPKPVLATPLPSPAPGLAKPALTPLPAPIPGGVPKPVLATPLPSPAPGLAKPALTPLPAPAAGGAPKPALTTPLPAPPVSVKPTSIPAPAVAKPVVTPLPAPAPIHTLKPTPNPGAVMAPRPDLAKPVAPSKLESPKVIEHAAPKVETAPVKPVEHAAPKPEPAPVKPVERLAPKAEPVRPVEHVAPRPEPVKPVERLAPRPEPVRPVEHVEPKSELAPARPVEHAAPRPEPAAERPVERVAPRPAPAEGKRASCGAPGTPPCPK